MLTSVLLGLAAAGWLASVLGAVLTHRGAVKLAVSDDDGTFSLAASGKHARWGLTLVVVGATAGAFGTILAVIASA